MFGFFVADADAMMSACLDLLDQTPLCWGVVIGNMTIWHSHGVFISVIYQPSSFLDILLG